MIKKILTNVFMLHNRFYDETCYLFPYMHWTYMLEYIAYRITSLYLGQSAGDSGSDSAPYLPFK